MEEEVQVPQQDKDVHQQVENAVQEGAVDAAQWDTNDDVPSFDKEAQQDASGFGASGSTRSYLRGPASLPR
jgi:hypothetical protein